MKHLPSDCATVRLDKCIEYLNEDELLEVTPESLRIRKSILDRSERGRQTKRAKKTTG